MAEITKKSWAVKLKSPDRLSIDNTRESHSMKIKSDKYLGKFLGEVREIVKEREKENSVGLETLSRSFSNLSSSPFICEASFYKKTSSITESYDIGSYGEFLAFLRAVNYRITVPHLCLSYKNTELPKKLQKRLFPDYFWRQKKGSFSEPGGKFERKVIYLSGPEDVQSGGPVGNTFLSALRQELKFCKIPHQ